MKLSLPPTARSAQNDAVPRSERLVVVVAFDDFQLLDLSGPVEVLRSATLLGADPPYRTLIATPKRRRARSESGVAVDADVSLAELARSRRQIDTLVVVGGVGSAPGGARRGVPASTSQPSPRRARRVTSVCTGRIAPRRRGICSTGTTRRRIGPSSDVLADQHPEVRVRADRIYVRDRDRWTSAGVTAGIDLFLALVEEDHGAELAHAVAGWLVVFVRRPGGQSQFSAQLARAAPPTPVDRRAAALAPRPSRRRPRRRCARGASRHEPADVRPGVPARDRHDARRVRRGRCGSRPPAGCSRRPTSPSAAIARRVGIEARRDAAPRLRGVEWAPHPIVTASTSPAPRAG